VIKYGTCQSGCIKRAPDTNRRVSRKDLVLVNRYDAEESSLYKHSRRASDKWHYTLECASASIHFSLCLAIVVPVDSFLLSVASSRACLNCGKIAGGLVHTFWLLGISLKIVRKISLTTLSWWWGLKLRRRERFSKIGKRKANLKPTDFMHFASACVLVNFWL